MFTYLLPGQNNTIENSSAETVINDDKSLMQAISMAFQGKDEEKLVIKFFIHLEQEQPNHEIAANLP